MFELLKGNFSAMRMTGRITHMEETKNAYSVLVGEPERKRPLRRPKRT